MKCIIFDPRYLYLFIMLFLTIKSSGQNRTGSQLMVELQVQDIKRTFLDSIKITLTDQVSGKVFMDHTNFSGLTHVILELDRYYVIEVEHPDFFSKRIEFDTETPGKRLPKYFLEFEIVLFHNCMKKPELSDLYPEPIALVIYDKRKKDFVFDQYYTKKAKAEYEKKVDELCPLDGIHKEIARKYKEEKKIRSKLISQEERRKQLYVDIEKKRQELIAASEEYNKRESIVANDDPDTGHLRSVEVTKPPDNNSEKFDVKGNSRVYIIAEPNWVTLVQRKMVYPEERIIIGTFSYTLNGEKIDIYVEDATELINKFPNEFKQSFPNWLRIYKPPGD